VVLFAYARPGHLARVLACLKENRVPLIYAFADGAKGAADAGRVTETRALLRQIDWAEVRLTERTENLGLGRSVLAGVDEVAAKHDSFIVWEDDLICVPGTYEWICAALRHYAGSSRVMSVSAWTHPRVTPPDVGAEPYFDARAECWVWGAWARSWSGVSDETALEKMRLAALRGIAPGDYGGDLPQQARDEQRRNVWAVRWLYHHFLHGGLSLRPPWSMVEHIGFDELATNAAGSVEWANPQLRAVPPQPVEWPEPVENALCRGLWQMASPGRKFSTRVKQRLAWSVRAWLKTVTPEPVRYRLRDWFGWKWSRGHYRTWAEARAASGGYDSQAILQKVLAASLEVQAGRAAFERDGVLFHSGEADRPLLEQLQEIVRSSQGHLHVLDFGGSLGSTYWRHRKFLPSADRLRWDIVEQNAFVEAGRKHLENAPLSFHHDVSSAQSRGGHDVLLCSSVLQYMEEPFRLLEEWSQLDISYLLLNNLPLEAAGPDRLTVQHVPPTIYVATYPVWFFNRDAFFNRVSNHYQIIREFAAEAELPVGRGLLRTTGLLLKRRTSP
jgi:putative methyltransferase (TIGR04325 family)